MNRLASITDLRDEEGVIIGFQVGKAAALSDWSFRREQRDFERLVKRLRDRNYRSGLTPEQRAEERARIREWLHQHPGIETIYRQRYRSKPGKRVRENAKQRARRQAVSAARRSDTVWTCVVCGASWRHDPAKKLPNVRPRYCGPECKRKARYQRDLLQPKKTGLCAECGDAAAPRSRYCGVNCRARWNYHQRNPGACRRDEEKEQP